jgi:hypothetical protein
MCIGSSFSGQSVGIKRNEIGLRGGVKGFLSMTTLIIGDRCGKCEEGLFAAR